jgi:S-formylglutathione hydrolase FrmB
LNLKFLERLKNDNIRHVARMTGGIHEYRVWRSYLNKLLELLFVPATEH